MTLDAPRMNSSRGSGAGGLGLLILGNGLIGVRVGWWHLRSASRFDPAADVTIQDFLDLKRMKQIREVWLEGADLFAGDEPAFVRDGRAFRFVHVIAPPAYRGNPAALNELKSGIDPSRFTVNR
ncbi:MAG TPA: hypothetical protein VMU54_21010 [Planctomycetota bacterium]|nr:hypothetical protein [Planctomycetota bacterium]